MIARVRSVWRDAVTLLFALRDKRTPLNARLVALLALIYALSPIDLLPDAIPGLGVADDVLVVPSLLALASQFLPSPVLARARLSSAQFSRRLPWLLPLIGLGLALLVGLLGYWVWRGLTG
jgi:uncharacterized membrane protein YkvA (DUF1232 family)